MRWVRKGAEPPSLTALRCAPTTEIESSSAARTAFDQLDKAELRARLATDQARLCVFCMRRIDENARDGRGEPTMKIAHRTPIGVDSARALAWSNLFGSCDGGQRSNGRYWTCDAAQGQGALTVDPSMEASIRRLRYERRDGAQGLYITSDDAALRVDVEETLELNSGDLPALREEAWKAFRHMFRKTKPNGPWGKAAWRDFLPRWWAPGTKAAPEMLGVIEAMVN